MQARVDVFVYPSEEMAKQDFAVKSTALKNLPPGEFPGTTLRDTAAIKEGDEAKGYQGNTIDANGNRLWVDAVRVKDTVVTIQLIAPDTQATATRTAIAKAFAAKVN